MGTTTMSGSDIGGRVRQAREQRGLTLGDAARLTKLPLRVLRAIERNDFDGLPPGMYRKAYLRTVAAEVGLDPREIAADYEAHCGSPIDCPAAAIVPDQWVQELRPPPRRTIATLTAVATMFAAWFVLDPDRGQADSRAHSLHSELDLPVMRSAEAPEIVAAVAGVQRRGPQPATAVTSPEIPLKIVLATTDWCWVAAESDGERVVYGLIEPGKRVVVEARRRISLRLGDAGAVRLSINDGPRRTPGGDGEVVELEFISDGGPPVEDGAARTESS